MCFIHNTLERYPPTPHNLAVSGHSNVMQVIFTMYKIYIFLKQERPEIEIFEKKTLVEKENFGKNFHVSKGYPCKNLKEYICMLFCFGHS